MNYDTDTKFFAFIFIILMFIAVYAINKQENKNNVCEKQGGVVVGTYGEDNCWLNGNFVKI